MNAVRKIGVILSALFLCACGPQATPHEEFLTLLDYEAQNRAFAFQSVARMARKTAEKETGPFWQAYADLEALNQHLYKPYLEKYNIDAEPRWATQLKGWAGGIIGKLFPETVLAFMQQATVAYVPKLQRLAQLAPESLEDKKFFAFVVAQEEVQAEAMQLLGQGHALQAADHITSFVKLHTQVSVAP